MQDPFDLQRFVTAQASTFETALAELHAGRKQTHWMWFIFPQLRGLGQSSTAHLYGIASLDEARSYLDHPVLGPRLDLATQAVRAVSGRSVQQIFGSPDHLKFRSSLTLFALASAEANNRFSEALDLWFEGRTDEATLKLLDGLGRPYG